ncbi:hypothetical protein AAG906_009906 [Vitis piasezkii]|uniref:Uncharacterized protein n=2 Tax=Vitis vinifera TaxID=29760 RepID=F6I384_VITVI|nr:hypothetical protein CK203_069856 [Vitis vinifera]WKA05524.1 hypothetical protein VitviT2T_023486 [Vitis vinifera]
MGIIKGGFIFVLGSLWGAYVARNYTVPDMKKLTHTGCARAKHMEQIYRKSKAKTDDIVLEE